MVHLEVIFSGAVTYRKTWDSSSIVYVALLGDTIPDRLADNADRDKGGELSDTYIQLLDVDKEELSIGAWLEETMRWK